MATKWLQEAPRSDVLGLGFDVLGLGSDVLGLGFEVSRLPYETLAPWWGRFVLCLEVSLGSRAQ